MEKDTEFKSLLRQVHQGSEAAAWTLVEIYGPHILRAVRRMLDQRLRKRLDSQDLVQAIWASVFAKPQRLLKLQQPEELIAYLAILARNTVIEESRRQTYAQKRAIGREVSLEDSTGAGPAVNTRSRLPSPSQVAIAREQWERMCENQPTHYRQIIELRLHGETYESIGHELGLSERTVRRVLEQLLRTRMIPVPEIVAKT
ncbi:MAG: sigma-70 family RNA polymerase sigma factor [Planctomycetes bacterium]|nr:sigma-70 family RNA polymerase sigma factor [Planctomycetota bacterium]